MTLINELNLYCGSADVAGCTGDSLVHVYTNWYRGWIYVYSCTTVPKTVCAPRESTKTPENVRKEDASNFQL